MVLVNKEEFQLVKKLGFVCVEHTTRTSHGRKYAVSDYDYLNMKGFIKSKFKVVEYR